MDCKTARELLSFYRRPGELDDVESAVLEGHLHSCPECDVLAQAEQQNDERVGQAMRQVEVPDHLRNRILTRLAADRSAHHRRRYGHVVRIAAAAALLLACVGIYGWWANRPAVVNLADVQEISDRKKEDQFSPPTADAIRGRFREMGVEAVPPNRFRYGLLTAWGLGEFKGQKVPQLVFVADGAAGTPSAHAQVLILSQRQFDITDLPDTWASEPGYAVRAEMRKDPELGQAYVIFHSGDDVTWLDRAE